MTRRKPPRVSWESWIDRAVEEGRQAGAFDNLKGKGEPLPGLDRPHDELWWVRQKLQEEGLSFLPPTLALRKQLEETMDQVARARSEAEVRRMVEELNGRIRDVNRKGAAGPPSTVMPLDVDRVVRRWRDGPGSAGDGTGGRTGRSEATGAQ